MISADHTSVKMSGGRLFDVLENDNKLKLSDGGLERFKDLHIRN